MFNECIWQLDRILCSDKMSAELLGRNTDFRPFIINCTLCKLLTGEVG